MLIFPTVPDVLGAHDWWKVNQDLSCKDGGHHQVAIPMSLKLGALWAHHSIIRSL